MKEENIYTHIEDTMSNIYLNGNMLNSGTVMVMLKEKDQRIKELEEQIEKFKKGEIIPVSVAEQSFKMRDQQLTLYKKALYWACNYISQKVDKDVNKLAHEWTEHFLQKAKEKINE